jgi:hypothetical protein
MSSISTASFGLNSSILLNVFAAQLQNSAVQASHLATSSQS